MIFTPNDGFLVPLNESEIKNPKVGLTITHKNILCGGATWYQA